MRRLATTFLIYCLGICAVATAQMAPTECDEITRILKMHGIAGLQKYRLVQSTSMGGNAADQRYYNIDLDGDDVSDELGSACSTSAAKARSCRLWASLSKGKRIEYTFDDGDDVFLFRRNGEVYVVSSKSAFDRPGPQSSIYLLDGTGVKRVCSNS